MGILPSEGLAAMYGPSGSGKSFLAFDLGVSITEGSDWFGTSDGFLGTGLDANGDAWCWIL
jgi:hypothetical protein